MAPSVEAGAVRTILLEQGLKEVRNPDDATIVWTDVDQGSENGQARRRASALPGVLSDRPDASSCDNAYPQASCAMV